MPHRVNEAAQAFFAQGDLPDIIAAINAANVSHIEHKDNRSRRNVADTVFLTTRAADFLVKLNDVVLKTKAKV